MKKNFLRQSNKTGYIVGTILIIFVIIIFCTQFKKIWSPTHIETTTLSLDEQQYILKFLEIESKDAVVEKVEFSHAREHMFFIYVTALDFNSLDRNYTCDTFDPTHYIKNNTDFPNKIECYFTEENGNTIAKFYLPLYDETLYDIVK